MWQAGQTEIAADTYSVETRLNAGVWQFRVMDFPVRGKCSSY